MFGGIDTEKFIGQLISVQLVADSQSGDVTSFTVPLSGFTLSIDGSSEVTYSQALPVILDSGTTLTYLPSRVISQIYDALDAKYDNDYGLAFIDCSYMTKNLTFSFQFGSSDGPIVSVPADEVVFDNAGALEDAGYPLPSNLGFDDICTFGIMPSDDYYLLGDTFLRSAYVVYDLQNQQVAIAQANLNSTESNVIEISNSTTALPDVTGVASQVSVTQTATGLPGVGGGATTGTGSSTSDPTTSPSSTGNVGAKSIPAPQMGAIFVAALTGVGMLAGGMIIAF